MYGAPQVLEKKIHNHRDTSILGVGGRSRENHRFELVGKFCLDKERLLYLKLAQFVDMGSWERQVKGIRILRLCREATEVDKAHGQRCVFCVDMTSCFVAFPFLVGPTVGILCRVLREYIHSQICRLNI